VTDSKADQIGEAAERGARRISSGAHAAEDAMKRTIDKSKERINDVVDIAASRMEDAHGFVTRQAREKPVQTTAIAVGAGLLLGLFMAGRRQ
jgi:ElaB/YqjD/DUF883 family membrane-anchored ribosome-binding protein